MKSIVALEVGRDSIKAAEVIAPLSKKPKVSKIGEIMLPAGVAGESLVHDKAQFLAALNQLWKQEKFSTKQVTLVVSGRRFMIKEHETAHTNMKDFYNVINYEVNSVIPDNMINPVVDYYPMYNKETVEGVKTVGLVVATPSEPIESMIEIITQAKLELMYVDFAPMAIARFIRNNIPFEENEGYALANIREYSTDILVAKENIPRIIRVAATGLTPTARKKGRHAKEDISTSLTNNSNSERSPIEVLAREIEITVKSQIDDLGINIDKLYITGSRNDPETMETLSNLTKMKIIPLNTNLTLHKNGLDEELTGSDFVAVCAGMRGKK